MKANSKQFLVGLFTHESELPLDFVIKQCSDRFGSLRDGLYVIADALSEQMLTVTTIGELSIADYKER